MYQTPSQWILYTSGTTECSMEPLAGASSCDGRQNCINMRHCTACFNCKVILESINNNGYHRQWWEVTDTTCPRWVTPSLSLPKNSLSETDVYIIIFRCLQSVLCSSLFSRLEYLHESRGFGKPKFGRIRNKFEVEFPAYWTRACGLPWSCSQGAFVPQLSHTSCIENKTRLHIPFWFKVPIMTFFCLIFIGYQFLAPSYSFSTYRKCFFSYNYDACLSQCLLS